jgi:hypothetical protein
MNKKSGSKRKKLMTRQNIPRSSGAVDRVSEVEEYDVDLVTSAEKADLIAIGTAERLCLFLDLLPQF